MPTTRSSSRARDVITDKENVRPFGQMNENGNRRQSLPPQQHSMGKTIKQLAPMTENVPRPKYRPSPLISDTPNSISRSMKNTPALNEHATEEIPGFGETNLLIFIVGLFVVIALLFSLTAVKNEEIRMLNQQLGHLSRELENLKTDKQEIWWKYLMEKRDNALKSNRIAQLKRQRSILTQQVGESRENGDHLHSTVSHEQSIGEDWFRVIFLSNLFLFCGIIFSVFTYHLLLNLTLAHVLAAIAFFDYVERGIYNFKEKLFSTQLFSLLHRRQQK